MKGIAPIVVAALAVLLPVAGRPAAVDDLLARMAQVNPGLHSFTATLHADVALKTFPFLGAQLTGTYYHKDAGMDKVVITSGLPLIAQQFDKLYPRIAAPAQWPSLFTVTLLSDDGSKTNLKLVPKTQGNVTSIDATVDDTSATVIGMRWNYANGGYAALTQRYSEMDGNQVVTSQSGHVEEPGYSADIQSTLTGYKLNPALADDVFQH